MAQRLPALLGGFATSPVELIEPLPIDFEDAAPSLVRPEAALQWINAHHGRSPLGRHALYIFETARRGRPGLRDVRRRAAHGESMARVSRASTRSFGGPGQLLGRGKGDLVVRMLLGWGGEGVRGDTQRIAQRLMARLMGNLLASHDATELGRVDEPVRRRRRAARAVPALRFPGDRSALAVLPQVRHATARLIDATIRLHLRERPHRRSDARS